MLHSQADECVLQVKTKTTGQCVEFYYLSKKLLDKQKKLKEQENRERELEQQKSVRNTSFSVVLVWFVYSASLRNK